METTDSENSFDPLNAPTIIVEHALPSLPARDPDGHKGTFGRVLVVGGSRGMAGAAALMGMAALRSGAGLVTVACPKGIYPIVAGFEPALMTLPLPEEEHGRLSAAASSELHSFVTEFRPDVLAFGPGVRQGAELQLLLANLLRQFDRPVVLDGDGLNLLALLLPNQPDLLRKRTAPTVLLPHPFEFNRLTGLELATIQADRIHHAIQFARHWQVVLVLKGPGSIVTDGRRYAINGTGNAGMATAGSGDVLTGIVAALIAQGLDAYTATRLAVYIHGRAGDLAADASSQRSLVSSDLLQYLSNTFREMENL